MFEVKGGRGKQPLGFLKHVCYLALFVSPHY